ncbi:hypothetical protein KY284_024118 [Solanum tuberosum]|nr:hypothetical protein KY284_024118 [Solanum tuberosum]
MLMRGHYLYGHLDGSIPVPTRTISQNNQDVANPEFVLCLRDRLARLTKDSRLVADYLHQIRSLCDELATAGAPVSNSELIVKILSGLGSEFQELSAVIRARDSTISYEELYEKLMDHELFLKYEDNKKPLSTNITTAVAQKTSSTPHRQGNNNYSRSRRPSANTPPNNQQWQAQPCRPQRKNQQ